MATNEIERCAWCGQALTFYSHSERRGTFGDETFCSMTCGYQMAVANRELLRGDDVVTMAKQIQGELSNVND